MSDIGTPASYDPKTVVRDFYEQAINRRDLGAVDRLLTRDFRHNGENRGREGQRQAVAAFLTAFPDLRHEILIILAEGDLVSAQQQWTGTMAGPFMGHAPNGRAISFASTAILKIRDGCIAEAWDVIDIGLAAQLA
jgi:predicted ester cyclase